MQRIMKMPQTKSLPERQTKSKKKTYSTPAAAKELGITAAQFRCLAKKKELIPVDSYENPHYSAGPDCPLWSAKDIGRLKRTKELKLTRERKKPDPERARAERMAKFSRNYPGLNDVLLDACTALFNLNRYAKWPRCSRKNRNEIYELKNQVIALMYARGMADRVYLHKQLLPEKQCFRCDGIGQDKWTGDNCNRCDGTGVFMEPSEIDFVVFCFMVGAKPFSWHQPKELVTWEFEETHAPGVWETAEIKPLEMKRSSFAQGKDLVRYAIQRLKEEPKPSS